MINVLHLIWIIPVIILLVVLGLAISDAAEDEDQEELRPEQICAGCKHEGAAECKDCPVRYL